MQSGPEQEQLDDLLIAADRSTSASAERHLSFIDAFVLWTRATRISAGRVPGVSAADLYRHFLWWCEREAITVSEAIRPTRWGQWLGKAYLRLPRRRALRGRRYYLNDDSAEYFRAWVFRYPSPPPQEGPFARALEVADAVRMKGKKGTVK